MQRVPNVGFYENVIEEHNYTMFTMYPPGGNSNDSWQLTKEEKNMVRIRSNFNYLCQNFSTVKRNIIFRI